MSENKRKVILDVDTGSDDAIAIMTALLSPELDVLGVVAVNGNQPLHNTTENTLRVKDLMHTDVPVIKGADTPIFATVDERRQAVSVNKKKVVDEDGNVATFHAEYFETLPESVAKPIDTNFISWYIDTIMNSKEKVTLIPVGPLTNIALLIRAEPRVLDNIEEIVIMGGGHHVRNCTSSSEFNIWIDPEAAQIVLTSGAKIALMTLDATHEALMTPTHSKALRDLGTKVGAFAADMIDERVDGYNKLQPIGGRPDVAPIHDALCVAYILDPSVITDMRHMRVDVDCGGGFADGQTVCDTREFPVYPKNAYVALGTDEKKFADMMVDILSRAKY